MTLLLYLKGTVTTLGSSKASEYFPISLKDNIKFYMDTACCYLALKPGLLKKLNICPHLLLIPEGLSVSPAERDSQ